MYGAIDVEIDADRAARLDRLLPQLPDRADAEHDRALDVLALVVGRRAGADVDERRLDAARRSRTS